jgi:hypothetical protein
MNAVHIGYPSCLPSHQLWKKTIILNVKFEVFVVMKIQVMVIWVVTSCDDVVGVILKCHKSYWINSSEIFNIVERFY